MTTPAIVMMIVAITIFWGGMAFCILRLRRHPDIGRDPARTETPEEPSPPGSI